MLKRFVSISVVSVMLASIWLTPAIADIINATTVNGIGASRTATAGYLYPLNSARKFPNGVLYTGSGKGLDADKLDGRHGSTTPYRGKYLILNGSAKFPNSVLYMGSGNGLDADMLDGFHAGQFLKSSGAQSLAGALTAESFNYAATQTGYLTLAPAAFQAYGPTKVFIEEEIYPDASFGGPQVEAIAPVTLPDGAVITELLAYVTDSTDTPEVQISLRRIPIDGTAAETLASASTTGSTPGWQALATATIASPVVDNADYAYQADVRMIKLAGYDHKIRAVRIKYSYTATGP